MKNRIESFYLYAGAMFLCLILLASVSAQAAEAPVRISLTASTTLYQPGEPIKMSLSAFNNLGTELIAQKGFSESDFHLMITFKAPDGSEVRYPFVKNWTEPGSGKGNGVPVELIAPDWESTFNLIANDHYALTKPGVYTAQVISSLETFTEYEIGEKSGELFSDPSHAGHLVFDPLVSNEVTFEIATPPAGIEISAAEVHVNMLTIGTGTRPPTIKEPLKGIPVRMYLLSAIPDDYKPVNWKTYSVIWDNVPSLKTAFTNINGVAKFAVVNQDEYVVIGLYDKSQDFRHMGGIIDAADPDWTTAIPVTKHLMVMVKNNETKKALPGKTTRRRGSDLLITEPEFVLWNDTVEEYPFVFESVGDWGIVTAVEPPEGFVADNNTLEAVVTTEMEAVQFTITDIGSRWDDTEVKHKIKHNGKSETIKSHVGIKLSKKLAKKKGLGIYGHTEPPGPFKGGKKVGHDKKEEKQ